MTEEILMKKTRYSKPQILAILRQAEGGVPVSELCREHGCFVLQVARKVWWDALSVIDASMISPMKALEDENRR
ncbi:MAG: hypothetical protein COB16_19780, partial [Rhodobacteraceae bacterium]